MNKLENFVSGEGNVFDQYMQLGNGQTALNLASSVGSILNYIAKNTTSNATLTDEGVKRKEVAQQVRIQ